jgi:hypothetical protein
MSMSGKQNYEKQQSFIFVFYFLFLHTHDTLTYRCCEKKLPLYWKEKKNFRSVVHDETIDESYSSFHSLGKKTTTNT